MTTDLIEEIQDGVMPTLTSFNHLRKEFIPKGESPADQEVVRTCADTRPLALKNTDNKTIAGVNNYLRRPVLSASLASLRTVNLVPAASYVCA